MECSIDLTKSPCDACDLKASVATNYLQITGNTAELHEPIQLSTLTSPLVKMNKQDFGNFSECFSPYPEILQKITTSRSEGKKVPSSISADLFLDSLLKKRDGCTADGDELTEGQQNFNKQMHRVKYYWRSTSLLYPFIFMRVKDCGENVVCEEDYSNKKSNPNDGLFN